MHPRQYRTSYAKAVINWAIRGETAPTTRRMRPGRINGTVSKRVSSEADGQPAATQPGTQQVGMSRRRNTVVQKQTSGARTIVNARVVFPVDTSGNATQGLEFPQN